MLWLVNPATSEASLVAGSQSGCSRVRELCATTCFLSISAPIEAYSTQRRVGQRRRKERGLSVLGTLVSEHCAFR